jgi:hypothetical protein
VNTIFSSFRNLYTHFHLYFAAKINISEDKVIMYMESISKKKLIKKVLSTNMKQHTADVLRDKG